MLTRAIALVAAGCFVTVSVGLASAPRTWRVSGVDGWKETERSSVGITSDGAVTLSRATTAGTLSAFVVWDLLRDGGSVLAATGDAGTLYRLDAEGNASEVLRVVQPEITSLGRDPEGRVLMGTSPDGVVYRLDGDRAVSVTDTPEEYIWRIADDGKRGTLLATGNSGKVYRLAKDGLAVLADPGAVHVTGLAAQGDNWLLTTDTPGRLLRMTPAGTLTVLHDAEEDELRSPVSAPNGAVYFLANPGRGLGRIYRLSPSGAVERIWESLDGFLYTLRLDDAGHLWVSTGSDTGAAAVVRVDPGPPATWHEAIRLEDLQAPSFLMEKGEPLFVGTSNQGRVHRVTEGRSGEGTVTSPVHDARGAARWGALTVEPRETKSTVHVEARSGNTRAPDTTWSGWSGVALEPNTGTVESPSGRFLQWRLTLTRPESRVTSVQVVYLPANLAPRVDEVLVTELGRDFVPSWDRGQPQSLGQDLPGGVHVEFQIPSSRGVGGESAPDETALWARRYRTVTWRAQDPNDDELEYQVSVRGQSEDRWNPTGKDLEASPWIWDSATVPDGWYQMRVTASDHLSNPPGEEQSAARTTDVFLVDNTSPRIVDVAVQGGRLTGRAVDEGSPIKNLEMSVDGGPWRRIFPDDGIPDQTEESFSMPVDASSSGEHVIVVRVFDQAGNVGTGRTRFTAP